MSRCLTFGMMAMAMALVATADPQRSGKPDISLKESQRISPFPPTQVEVRREKRGAIIKWKEVPLERIVAYEIFRSVNHGPFRKIGRLKAPPYVDKSPPKGKVVYAVASVDRENNRSKLMQQNNP